MVQPFNVFDILRFSSLPYTLHVTHPPLALGEHQIPFFTSQRSNFL